MPIMDKSKILFWNVDTQVDFIEPQGKLYVPKAEEIRPVLRKITDFARLERIRVISTCDWHHINSTELSRNPDYITSFPEHCMAGTYGAEFIPETLPEFPNVFDWDVTLGILPELDDAEKYLNIVIRKDAFDVFAGNPHTDKIIQMINPGRVFVYGVTTNVCVDQVVTGLAERGLKVYIFEDAIKELPNIPLPYLKWRNMGIELISFANVREYF
jgi:nicotinamidase/pyrazinamidase